MDCNKFVGDMPMNCDKTISILPMNCDKTRSLCVIISRLKLQTDIGYVQASDTGILAAFWVRNAKWSEAEVDFVCNIQSTLISIEVKAGLNSKLRSLHSFVDQSHRTQNSALCRLAVRIWSVPYSSDTVTTSAGNSFLLLNVPFYLIGALNRILEPYLNEGIASPSDM